MQQNLEISPQDFLKLYNDNFKNLILIDIRTIAEYSQGYIVGSSHIVMDDLTVAKIEILVNQKSIEKPSVVLYCRSGVRSLNYITTLKAYEKEELEEMGVKVLSLAGGINAMPSDILTKN
jgi:rhodanese-related sulfurtransferase